MDQQEKIKLLQRIVQMETVNDHESLVADYLATLFQPYPNVEMTRVRYKSGRDNLVVTIGTDHHRQLGFAGHMDVVATGDPQKWDHAPFSGDITDDFKMVGRGASDMKAGLAAMVIAALELLDQGEPQHGQIKLICTIAEESTMVGSEQLTKEGYLDDLDALVICEGSGLDISYTHNGDIDYRVTSHGKAAHSASPEMGVNAIENLMTFWHTAKAELAKFDETDAVLGNLLHNVTVIKGGEQINSIPAEADLEANIRLIPQTPAKVVKQRLEAVIATLNQQPGFELDLEYLLAGDALPGDQNGDFVQFVKRETEAEVGHEVTLSGDKGTTDGSKFIDSKGDFPMVIVGPGSNTAHQVNEYVDLNQYLKAIELYKNISLKFLEGDN